MANLILPPEWQGKEKDCTDEQVYQSRRRFIRQLGLGSIALASTPGLLSACTPETRAQIDDPTGPLDTIPKNAPRFGLPAQRNAAYTVPERGLTERITASSYTNFYEFKNTGDLKNCWPLTGAYEPFPWTLEVDGLVEKSFKVDLEDLIKEMGLEERIYRFRCVEALVDDDSLDRFSFSQAD